MVKTLDDYLDKKPDVYKLGVGSALVGLGYGAYHVISSTFRNFGNSVKHDFYTLADIAKKPELGLNKAGQFVIKDSQQSFWDYVKKDGPTGVIRGIFEKGLHLSHADEGMKHINLPFDDFLKWDGDLAYNILNTTGEILGAIPFAYLGYKSIKYFRGYWKTSKNRRRALKEINKGNYDVLYRPLQEMYSPDKFDEFLVKKTGYNLTHLTKKLKKHFEVDEKAVKDKVVQVYHKEIFDYAYYKYYGRSLKYFAKKKKLNLDEITSKLNSKFEEDTGVSFYSDHVNTKSALELVALAGGTYLGYRALSPIFSGVKATGHFLAKLPNYMGEKGIKAGTTLANNIVHGFDTLSTILTLGYFSIPAYFGIRIGTGLIKRRVGYSKIYKAFANDNTVKAVVHKKKSHVNALPSNSLFSRLKRKKKQEDKAKVELERANSEKKVFQMTQAKGVPKGVSLNNVGLAKNLTNLIKTKTNSVN